MKSIIKFSAFALIFGASIFAMESSSRFSAQISELEEKILQDQYIQAGITAEIGKQLKLALLVDGNLDSEIFCFKLFMAQSGLPPKEPSSDDAFAQAYSMFLQRKIYENKLALQKLRLAENADILSDSVIAISSELQRYKNEATFSAMLGLNLFTAYLKLHHKIDYLSDLKKQEIDIALKRKDQDWQNFLRATFISFVDEQELFLQGMESQMSDNIFDVQLQSSLFERVRFWQSIIER